MIEKAAKVGRASVGCPTKKVLTSLQSHLSQLTDLQSSEHIIEILVEGQECPFCHFAKLKKDGDEIVCPICGYGCKPCT
ncbi:MAG: hypothetical protein MUO91_03410 [candidate division Zixibacteria bacterium]|nr:hypothetical protein [candidate division Zixibacteria bacterium]